MGRYLNCLRLLRMEGLMRLKKGAGQARKTNQIVKKKKLSEVILVDYSLYYRGGWFKKK